VSVQGQQVEVDAQGRFSVTVPASAGVQHLTVEAQDGVQPSGARQELDVMWGRAFAQETSARISDPDGVQVRIAPTLLDQNRPIARRSGRSAQFPDLAGYLELVFQESDLTAMNDLDSLGDLVTSILAIDGVRLGSVAVDVMSIEQGVEVRLSLIGAEMDINGVLLVRSGPNGAAGVDGTLTLDASLSVRLSVDPQGAVELRGADIQISDLRSNVATRHTTIPLAEVQRAIQTRGGALRNHLEMILDTQLLRPFVVGSVPALVEGIFTGSQSPLEREDRDITGLDGRAAHVAKGGQSQGWTARTGAPLTWIGAQSWTRSGNALLGTEGGMLQVRARGAAPAFDASAPLQLAVGLENFNAPLHSVWRSGGFQADLAQTLGPIYGAALESGTMNAALPPSIVPNAEGDGMVLQAGQVEASFIIEGREVRVAGSVEVPVVAAIDGDALTVSVEGQAQTRVWFVSGDASLMPRVSQVFEAGLGALQRVAASTLDGSEVKLPSFDLSDTAQTSPRFGGASARATLEGGPDLRDGWLIVGLGQEITAGR
jgi:hypothetical protein